MKKINLFLFGLVAMLGFGVSVSAADTAGLSCLKSDLSIGESTTCTVSITTASAVSSASITLKSSEHLIISDAKANDSAGWQQSAASSSSEYVFNRTVAGAAGKSDVFSFTLTLSESAKNLSKNDDCGNICIAAVTLDKGTVSGITENSQFCYRPTIVPEEKCEGEDCNPKTGAFANYVAIAAVAVIAVGAILVARRSSKFYRV